MDLRSAITLPKRFIMRAIFIIAFALLTGWCSAQAFFPGNLSYNRLYHPASPYVQIDSSIAVQKKWSLQTFSSVSAGMMFWKGGSASYVSAPLGLQLTRTISNNVFAFAAISAAPAVVNFRQAYDQSNFKNAGMQGINQPYKLGGYGRAELGLGYTNDARTFTITGSIGVERSTYPIVPGMPTYYGGAGRSSFPTY